MKCDEIKGLTLLRSGVTRCDMAEDTSYHHLYYSAHADPVEELEKLNKPPPCIKLRSPTKDGDGAFQSRSDQIQINIDFHFHYLSL